MKRIVSAVLCAFCLVVLGVTGSAIGQVLSIDQQAQFAADFLVNRSESKRIMVSVEVSELFGGCPDSKATYGKTAEGEILRAGVNTSQEWEWDMPILHIAVTCIPIQTERTSRVVAMAYHVGAYFYRPYYIVGGRLVQLADMGTGHVGFGTISRPDSSKAIRDVIGDVVEVVMTAYLKANFDL